jgi:hypothetical protein|tara:strand:+ start:61 stop:678 length:618 start_codon:yes stop_codon:yes gene_type:complete
MSYKELQLESIIDDFFQPTFNKIKKTVIINTPINDVFKNIGMRNIIFGFKKQIVNDVFWADYDKNVVIDAEKGYYYGKKLMKFQSKMTKIEINEKKKNVLKIGDIFENDDNKKLYIVTRLTKCYTFYKQISYKLLHHCLYNGGIAYYRYNLSKLIGSEIKLKFYTDIQTSYKKGCVVNPYTNILKVWKNIKRNVYSCDRFGSINP